MTIRTGSIIPQAATHRADGEAIAVIGTSTVMRSHGPANALVVDPTQLISARFPEPRQWVVTLQQAQQAGFHVTPWADSGFNAIPNTVPDNTLAGTRNFSAPSVPFTGSGTAKRAALQCDLTWGAGGARFQTRFDYPVSGRVFGVTADKLELNVFPKEGATNSYADAQLLPYVGAFMVQGIVTDAVPLRWQEPEADPAAGQSVWFSVKPYARRIHMLLSNQSVAWGVQWFAADASTLVWTEPQLAPSGGITEVTIDVPSSAALLRLINNGAGAGFALVEWQIGLT